MEHFDWVMGAFLPYLNFTIFICAAIYFFKGPIRTSLESRREKYDQLIRSASKAKHEAEARNEELKARLKGLDEEIGKMRHNTETEAKAAARRILEDAHALAEQIKVDASRVALVQFETAFQNLKRDLVADVKREVEKKAREAMTKEGSSRFAMNRLDELREGRQ